MKNSSWIILFFIALAGYIAGIQLSSHEQNVILKGGRSFKINFKKKVDVEQVREDLTNVFEGNRPILKTIGDNATLVVITDYMIDNPSLDVDSIVLAKLMIGLKDYLPPGITYEEFDKEYKSESTTVLPVIEPPGIKARILSTLRNTCKPLLMPLLVIFLLVSLKGSSPGLKQWILAALFFSWAGDVLLMFEASDKKFFMLGLSAFLIAHVFYIIFFHNIRIKEGVKGNPWLMVVVVVYYGALITLLSPFLGDLKWPVRVYGIVISFMFMLAMHMPAIKNKVAGKWIMTGALLFIISDSVLAINKFYKPFEGAGIVIIVTYGLAQLFIVQGAVKYIRGTK